MPGGGDLPGGRPAGQVAAVCQDQLRLRRRSRRGEQADRRVRDRAQRPESTPGITLAKAGTGRLVVQSREGVSNMPEGAWSDKRERQYKHIKESEKKQG